jgi:hypothetical protein
MFLSEAVESAKRPHTLHESKALNMGIAELEPRQLAPTVGTTGSGSTGSPAPSSSSSNVQIASGNSSTAAAVRSRFRFDKQREVNLAC